MEINKNEYKKCTPNCPPVTIPSKFHFQWFDSKSTKYMGVGMALIILSILVINKEPVLQKFNNIKDYTSEKYENIENNVENAWSAESIEGSNSDDETIQLVDELSEENTIWSEYKTKYKGKKGLLQKKAKKFLENYWYGEWGTGDMYEEIDENTYNGEVYKILNVYKTKKKRYKIFYYLENASDEVLCDTITITKDAINKTSEYCK